jgi:hypothetical protein
MSTGNGLKDTMNFGKMKGKTIAEVITVNPRYLCWLRDDIAKNKRQSFLDQEANDKLDEWIWNFATTREKRDYRHWQSQPPEFMVKATIDGEPDDPIAAAPTHEPVVAYAPSADWGTW